MPLKLDENQCSNLRIDPSAHQMCDPSNLTEITIQSNQAGTGNYQISASLVFKIEPACRVSSLVVRGFSGGSSMTVKTAFFSEKTPTFTYGLTAQAELFQMGSEVCGWNGKMRNILFGLKDSKHPTRKMNSLRIDFLYYAPSNPQVQLM
jgi:hypothetical protein